MMMLMTMTISTQAALAIVCLICATIPAVVFLLNCRRYLPPSATGTKPDPISVLIPARNESTNIDGALATVLAQRDVELEVIVLNDHSTDDTADRVKRLAEQDPRVVCLESRELPPGWCGKMFACHQLAEAARNPLLVFMDADVRLTPFALRQMAGFMETSVSSLASGIPRQKTVSFWERALIPLIHFVLLGFLPIGRMRRSTHPSYGAGCGQLFMARRKAYLQSGGHAAISGSRHDGLKLPRNFRRHGFKTDLFDATDVASCRMYDSAAGVWNGLAKNATEGLGAPGVILPMSLLLVLGQTAPIVGLVASLLMSAEGAVVWMFTTATVLAFLPRIVACLRFQQNPGSALFHPLGVACLVFIQWWAWVRRWTGSPVPWKGRTDGAQTSPSPTTLSAWAAGACRAHQLDEPVKRAKVMT